MSGMNAWILDFGMGYRAAVGGKELLHLVDMPTTFTVPCTPMYCHRVLSWQDRLLPVMDVASKLGGMSQDSPFIGVIGYQQKRGEYPQFGALLLASPPQQVAVSDDQACNMPEEKQGWGGLAIACFNYNGAALPVLNLNLLFNPVEC